MKKRILVTLALVAVASMLFSGCSIVGFKQMNELMRPPKAYGENAKLREAFDETVQEGAILKAPVNGENLSSFVVTDIDDDGYDEAAVFYTPDASEVTVNVYFFDYTEDDVWTPVKNIVSLGSDVYSVEIIDINNDGLSEFIVSWSLYDTNNYKIVSVYKFPGKANDEDTVLSEEKYTIMKPIDIDVDGNTELFIVLLETTLEATQATAKVIKMNSSGEMMLADKKTLDSGVSTYAGIKTDEKETGEPPVLYLDAYKGETQMITEVVYWDKDTDMLRVPFLDEESQTNKRTLRNNRLETMDINGDGLLEIPYQVQLEGSTLVKSPDVHKLGFYLTKWGNFNGGRMNDVSCCILDLSDTPAFMLDITGIMNENSFSVDGATDGLSNSTWTFYPRGEIHEDSNRLMDMKTVTSSDWIENGDTTYSAYRALRESVNSKTVIISQIYDGGKSAGITYQKLIDGISFFNNRQINNQIVKK